MVLIPTSERFDRSIGKRADSSTSQCSCRRSWVGVPLLVFGPSRQTKDPRFRNEAHNNGTEAVRTKLPSRHATPVHENEAKLEPAISMNTRVQHISCDVTRATRSPGGGRVCMRPPKDPGSSILPLTLLLAVETAVGAGTAHYGESYDALVAPWPCFIVARICARRTVGARCDRTHRCVRSTGRRPSAPLRRRP